MLRAERLAGDDVAPQVLCDSGGAGPLRVSEEAADMATDSVRVKLTSYLGGIPGQERRNSGNGTLHLGPRSLYVGKAEVLGAAVVGVKYGKVDLDKISSIGIRAMTMPERVAITVHLKDGSTGASSTTSTACGLAGWRARTGAPA
jgi:hypothetical protein